MKAMVIYDSGFGNTVKKAQAIRDGLSNGADNIELRHVGEVKPEQLQGLDVLIVGSPTQRCRPTPATNEFLDSILNNALQGIRVAGFDTRFTEEEIDAMGFIVSKMLNFCTSQQHVAEGNGLDIMRNCDTNPLSPYNSLTTGVALQDVGSDQGYWPSMHPRPCE